MDRYLITNKGRDVERTKSLFDYLIRKFIPKWLRDLMQFIKDEVSNFEIFKNIYLKVLKVLNDLLNLFQARLSVIL